MNHKNSRQKIERRAMVFVTVVLCLGFFTLYGNLKNRFQTVEDRYKNETALNLNQETDTADLSAILIKGSYISDEKDAEFIARHIIKTLNERKELPNLGELNKNAYRVSALLADAEGGVGLKLRVNGSLAVLGITDEVEENYSRLKEIPHTLLVENGGKCRMEVTVQQPDAKLSGITGYLKKAVNKDKKPAENVLVRLKKHYYITRFDKKTKETVTEVAADIIGYALTDSKGIAVFAGLSDTCHYSVLPMKKGFEYGASQGTTKGSLGTLKESRRTFTFLQREHKITPFDMLTYMQIKEDNALTVRTPSQFKSNLAGSLIFFFMAWWGLSFFLHRPGKKTDRKEPDPLLLPILMTLSGIGLLMMYSVTNPLTDKLLGYDMAIGAIGGAVAIGFVSQIDFAAFAGFRYQWFGWFNRNKTDKKRKFPTLQFDFIMQFMNWLSKPFREKIQSKNITKEKLDAYHVNFLVAVLFFPFELILRIILWPAKPFSEKICTKNISGKNLIIYRIKLIFAVLLSPVELLLRPVRSLFKVEGAGYLLIAFLLIGLLGLFGTGPEGSGVKVNLFFFQPSEITKYLIVVFLAAFFKNNAEKIQKFAEKLDRKHLYAQFKTVAVVILGICILLGCYLVLGDMGPALVLAVTFIIIYSVMRRDSLHLLAGVISFIGLLFFGFRYDNSPGTLAAFAALWLFLWIIYGLSRKRLYESAVFMNLVIAAFIFGGSLFGSLGLSHQAQRLQDRSDICLSGIWDNEVRGGDQVVQGVWSMASGGITGQGLGEGNPNLTPAFHTDMIFTSIGEVMGWLGMLLIVLCMAILIHRSLHIGYRAGNPFLFFLATGIAAVTGIQFLVITSGSVGLIPLTGVAVPFLSFGKTSLIINLAAFGILISISKKKATEIQIKEIKPYSQVIGVNSLTYFGISAVLLAYLFWNQVVDRDNILIRPAFVSNQQGERVAEYNPRIRLLIKHLDAGNICDRNGIVLATNDRTLIQEQISNADGNIFASAGVDAGVYTKELQQYKQRYYPFGNNLFFWLGDYNTSVLWDDSETYPRGYIAERRHLAGLRGFNNLKDKNGNAVERGLLKAKKYKGSPFLNPIEKEYHYVKYNYAELLPMLKGGLNGSEVKAWNKKRIDRDITLTVDAALQTKMQNEISNYVSNPELYGISKDYFKGERWNKLRISVVVLDAQSGDLLCSANYPLPNQDTLKYKPDYNERIFREKAYTDRDLGLTFQSAPGSTAKVMSALAGLKKPGTKAEDEKYHIYPEEIIERGRVNEPNGYMVSLEDAIVISSNCYFINLVNNHNLYSELADIYSAVGIRIDKKLTERTFRPLTPYYFGYEPSGAEYNNEIASTGAKAVHLYDDYITNRNENKVFEKMSGYAKRSGHDWNLCAWAWGQGSMSATPLNMARVASIVANAGNLAPTRFILKGNYDKTVERPQYTSIPIVSEEEAAILKGYMKKETQKHTQSNMTRANFPENMGGKTGTPERDLYYTGKDQDGKTILKREKKNDGWYIFFTDSENPLAIAVRMERLPFGSGSGTAVRLTDKAVMKVLTEAGYIKH